MVGSGAYVFNSIEKKKSKNELSTWTNSRWNRKGIALEFLVKGLKETIPSVN
jgi:hypothetical protein